MASDPQLRHEPGRLEAFSRSVDDGPGAPVATLLAGLLVLLVVVTGLLAATQLASHRGGKATSQTSFLTKALGSPQDSAPLVRKPSRTQTVHLHRNGFTYTHGTDSISLAANGAGAQPWTRHRNGVTRSTPFGAETITVTSRRTEQYLTVSSRQGHKTWTWRLDTNLDLRLNVDGGIDLGPGTHVDPVQIVDKRGHDVTPDGLRWSIDGNTLSLTLDDARLPLPYVIDPAVDYGDSTNHTTEYITKATSATWTTTADNIQASDPAAALCTTGTNCPRVQDNTSNTGPQFLTFNATLNGSSNVYSATPTAPAASSTDPDGWIVDAVGNASPNLTDIPSGTWTFKVDTQASGAYTTNPTHLVVGAWVVTTSGTTISSVDQTIVDPTTAAAELDPTGNGAAASNLTVNTTKTTRTITVTSVPEVTLNASQRILVKFYAKKPSGTWRSNRVTNIVVGSSASDTTNLITHPAVSEQPNVPALVSPANFSAPSTGWVTSSTTSLTATFDDFNNTDTGQLNFELCGNSTCTAGGDPIASGTSSSTTLADSTNGSWTTPTLTNGGDYFWLVQAQDQWGTKSAYSTAREFKVDTTVPTSVVQFPADNGKYNAAGWDNGSAGCTGTPASSICGTVSDLPAGGAGVEKVEVSILESGSSQYYGGSSFNQGSETFLTATGTANWNYGITSAKLTSGRTYTIHAKATDYAGNVESQQTFTFLYDATAPTYSSSATDIGATHVTLTLTEAESGLDAGSTTPTSAFTVDVNSSPVTVSSVSTTDSTHVELTLASRVFGDDVVTVAYSTTGLSTAQKVKDLAGNALATFTAQTATNTAPAALSQSTVTPSPASITANGSSTTTVTVQLKNSAGSNLTASGGTVTLSTTDGTFPGSCTSNCATTDNGNGTYTATLTSSTTAHAVTVTAKLDSSTVSNTGAVTFAPGPATKLLLGAATTTPTAGVGDNLTVTAQDVNNNTATSYTGDKNLTFGGASAGGGNNPTVTDKTGSAIDFGNSTTITFTSGVATVSGSNNGVLKLYKAESPSLTVSDGSINNGGGLSVTTGAATAASFSLAANTTTPAAGAADGLTITAKDSYGNTATGYTGDHSLTLSGANASPNPVTQPTVTDKTGAAVNFGSAATVTFTAGVSSAGGSMVLYKAEGANIGVTDGSISQGSALAVTVSQGSASKFVVSGSATQTAGLANAVSVTAQDAYGNTATGYSGDKSLTFSGANANGTPPVNPTVTDKTGAAVDFGTTTTVTFTSGVSSAGGSMVLYKNETANIVATQGAITTTGGDRLTVTVNSAADGTGTLGLSGSPVLAGTSNTITFTYTAPTGGMTNGALTIDVPAGWTAPQTGAGAGQVTSDVGSVSVSGQTVTVSSVSLNAGQTMTITYANGVATMTTGTAQWTAKQKSTSGGTLTDLASQPSATVNNAADGSGTVAVAPTSVLAGTTNTETFTFTVPTGGMTNGVLTIDVPAGWTAPQTGAGAGQVTSSSGSVSTSSQTITVSSLSLNAGQTVTVTYASGVATTTTGSAQWTTKQKSTSGGTLTNLAAQPSVTVDNAADGTGTVGVSPTSVLAGTSNTETFTFTAPTGGMTSGAVTIDVPAGWTAPQTGAGAGQVTSDVGSVSVSGQTITVSSLSRNAGQTVTITYANGVATTTTGSANWTTKQKSTSGGTLTNLAAQPSVSVSNAADGSGTVGVTPTSVLAGTSNTETFTFTAPTGGMTNGAVTIDVPAGWTAPQTGAGAGQVTSSAGSVSVSGQTITVASLSKDAGQTVTITYASGVAPTSTGSAQWTTKQKSTSGGTLTNLAAQPSISVDNAADGSGTVGVAPTSVLAGTSSTETFTYTAPTGGMTSGALAIDVPAGWTAPQAGAGAGQVTSDVGSVSVSGQTITISGVSRNAGQTVTVTYASGVATTTTGTAEWTTKQKSTSGGTLTNLAAQPSVSVDNAADGSGTIAVSPTAVPPATTNTLTFTYTAPTGGMTNGAVTIDVPAGWTAPQTGAGAGHVTSDVGSVSVSGQTITVSSLSRNAGQIVTVTYADGSSPSSTGPADWTTKQKSTSGGTLTDLAGQPSVTVTNAPDGSGTMTSGTPSVLAASSGNTITFTYTAATGGLASGSLTLDVPAGWTTPQTGAGAGQVTSSAGSVSVSGQTVTVDSLTLGSGGTVTVTYANATASSSTGVHTFTTMEKSTPSGTLTALSTSPSITVTNAADGSGTLSADTGSVLAGSSGNTIAFTYTAATGGMSNGGVKLTVPTGWTAPTTSAGAGHVDADSGSVSVSGRVVTVDSVTLAAGATLTITYSNGTAPSTTGSQAWSGEQRSTGGGSYTALSASPSISVDNAPHGSGTLSTATTTVERASSGNSITFTYTAATGGMSSGAITLDVPTGWTAPQTAAGAGQVTSSAGSVSVSGRTVTVDSLSLAGGATVDVTYSNGTAPATTGAQTWSATQKSTSGGTLTALAVSPSITVQDTIAPVFSSATANGTSLAITFDETLDGSSTPAGSAFTVKRNGSTLADPTNVALSGSTATLTLAAVIRNGDTVTVAYTQPGANRLRDGSANNVTSFGDQAVTNSTASLTPDVPALVSPGAGATVATATPTLTATFSDIDTTNTGQITFRVCDSSDCSNVLATFSSSAGIANGANGSASVPGGTITSDSTYYWQAKATDNTTAASAFSSSRSFVVDTTAPALQSAGVDGTSLTLTYDESLDASSVPAALAYGLHVNGGSAVTPTNVAISGFAVTLTFAAGAVHNGDAATLDYSAGGSPVQDAVGNDAGNLSAAVVTNSTASLAPDVPALVTPTAAQHLNTLTPSLIATFSDADTTNTGQITFRVCDSSDCSNVLATFSSGAGIANGANGSASVPGGTITSDGTYYWQAKATDNTTAASAFSSSRSFVVDTTAPVFASANVDGSSLAVVFDEPLNGSSTPAGSAFTVRVNGSAQADPTNVSVAGSTVTLTLAAAVHNDDAVTVAYAQPGSGRVKDVAGNDAASFSAQSATNNTVSVAPDVPSLVSPADAASLATRTPTLRASFADADTNNTGQLTFRVCSDSGCSSILSLFISASGTINGANASAAVPGGDLTADGTYYWQAKATDNQGVSSAFSSSRSFTVDTTAPPVPTIDSGPGAGSTSGPDVTFTFSDSEGGATFEVQLDGGGWNAMASPKSYASLSDGSHTFQVRAVDALGNTSSAFSRTWTVDATAPALPTIDSGPAASSTSGKNVSFGFSDSEGTATFEVQLDGGGYTSATSPQAYTNLSDGSHTFQVRAVDVYGNTSSAVSRTWTVDATAPPAPTIDSGPAAASTSGPSVSFGFSDTEGTATFEVQIDGGGFASSTSPKAYAGLSDGSHTFQVRAVDAFGNTSSATSRTWTVDATAPPAPTIDSGPAASSTSGKNVSFGFSDTEGTATFEVQLDGGGYTSATSPQAYTNLSDGSHTFQVRAVDVYGNTSSAVSRTWTVDATAPPLATIDSGPAAASTSGPSVSFGFSDTEGTATFEVQLDGGGFASSTSPKAYAGLSDGSHTFQVRAVDAFGNTSSATSRTWTVDATAPPAPSIDSGPAGASTSGPTVSFGFSDSEGSTTFEVSLDGGAWLSGSSPQLYSGLSDGSHTFQVRALDAYGNTSSATSRTWTVDATAPPAPSIDSGPAAASTSGKNVSFGFSDTEGTATFEVQLDGGGYGSATSPKAYTNLSDGSHTFEVRAVDGYGNTSSSTSRTWTVDATAPPLPTIDSGPAGSSTSGKNVSLAFSDTEGTATFEVDIDGGGWGAATSPQSYTNLSDGSHTFQVRAVDTYGNTTAAVSRTWTVDATAPPAPTIDSGPAGGSTSGKNVSFGFSDTEGTATFEVQLDGGGYGSATSPKAYTNLTQGSHAFDVHASDAYGNTTSSVSRTWTVDATAPTVSMTSPSDGQNVSGTVTLTSSAADAGGSGLATVAYEYAPTGTSSWTSTPAAWDTAAASDGGYDLRAIATDNAGNSTTSAIVSNVLVDNHAPTVSIVAPQYVNASDPASITLTASSADTDISQVEFFECSNATTNCSGGSWNSIAVDATLPYSTSWTVPAGDGNKAVRAVATDGSANTGSDVDNVLVDRTAPAGGSVSYTDGYVAGNVTITTNDGSDGGSGIDAPTSTLERDETTLTTGTCAAFPGSWSAVSSPDSTTQSGKCYRYRHGIADRAGNVTTYTSANVVKVDTSAPTAVSLGYSALTNAFQSAGTVYFKQGGAGGFTVTATSSDPQSGVASTTYPALGSGWSETSGAYTFNSSAAAPSGGQTVTVTNGAGLQSTASFTVVGDAAAPSAGSVTVATGFHSLTNVDLTLDDGTDAGSGVDASSELLQRADATLTGGVCDAFGSFATIATDPALSYNDAAVASGHCYQYRYVVSDKVGNAVTYTSSSTVKIDADDPSGTLTDPGAYVRGTLSLTASASDTGGSGVASVAFQRSPAGGGVWTTIGTDTSSPYGTSFDTTAVADGLYDLRVLVTDGAGNQATSAIVGSRRVDNTAPSASMTDPGQYLRGTITLASSSSDAGSGVASTVYQYSSAGAGSWTTTGASLDTTLGATPDGLYDFRVIVTDNAGNQTTSTVTNRRIDNTPPIATMDDPGAYLRGTVALTSGSSDPGGSGVASSVFQASPAGAGSYSGIAASWDTTGVGDGLYDLHVVVTDNAGNIATSAPRANVRVDNTAPTVSVTSPADNANVTGTVTLTDNASDAGSGIQTVTYAYTTNGGSSWTSTPAAWDTTALSDGSYDLRATATDRAGNATTSARVANVTVDNVSPTVSFASPVDTEYVNAASADPKTLTANASDAGTGIASVEFFACSNATASCSSGSWSSLGTDTTSAYTAAWAIPADGNRALKAVATDLVGHTASQVIDVRVDRTLPETTILTKPGDPSNVATPQFTFSSNEAGATFECRIDGGGWGLCTSPDTLAALGDGSHTFDVRAVDPAGNTDASADSWTWLVDLTNPTGTLADPGRNVRGTVTLNGSASDPGASASGVATLVYEYSDDGTTWVSTPAAWNTVGPPAVADGVYQVHIVVTDRAGNVYTTPAITNVRVDNTPPTSSMDDPGANLRGTVNLTAAASDTGSGIAQVEFQAAPAGTGAWASAGTTASSPYSVSFNTGTLADGLYDFRTVATDVAGNLVYSSTVANRRIDNTPPTASVNNPGSPLRGVASLTSSTSDAGSGISSVQYEVSNGGAWTQVPASWNTAGSSDGTYSVRVVARDVAGNVTTSAAVTGIVVDNTAPATTDNAPAGWQNSAVTVNLNATDGGSGVSATQYSLDGGGWTTGTSVLVPAADGSHTIAYYSVDNAGNVESQHSATVLVQATAPACPSCTAADFLRGTVTLTASPTSTGAPITSVEFKRDATTIGTDTTAPYSVSWNTTLVADGGYDLTVVVTDAASNVSTIDLGTKVVDNTLPTAAVGAPTAGTSVGGTVSFSSVVADANLDTIVYFVNGTQVGSTGGAAVNWDTTALADGTASLYVVATDRAGNTRTSGTVSVTVDNTAPSIALVAPSTGTGVIALSANTSADTATVEFQRSNGGGWTTIATVGSPFSTNFDTTTVADGTYQLRALATDGGGHTSTSASQALLVDNTAPTGAIATPLAGDTVGGSVDLTATPADATSGVASVAYEMRQTGAPSFTAIGSATSAPWHVSWSVWAIATGSYDLRAVITDNNGNVFRTAPITVSVDTTAPLVALDVPNDVSGRVTLSATTQGPGATSVEFGISPAGSGRWSSLGLATVQPWGIGFESSTVADGLYDFRAIVTDNHANQAFSVVRGVRVDNTAPSLVSSWPADGAIVKSCNWFSIDASETLAAVEDATVDGLPAAAPVLAGDNATFNTGALSLGFHVLAGTLRDLSGKETPFQVHVTVQAAQTTPGEMPPVEKNSTPDEATTIATADDGITVTMPAGAWPTTGSANASDWVVLRVDPAQMPASLPLDGFEPAGPIYDVTARWALAAAQIHTGFGRELVLVIPNPSGKALPATKENGVWHLIPQLSAPGAKLDGAAIDGYYREGAKVYILSRHLTPFTLVKDVGAPSAPTAVSGTFGSDGLTLQWTSGKDNSGSLGVAIVYADEQPLATVPAGLTRLNVGSVDATDLRSFTIVQTDPSGNASNGSTALRMLPDLTGMTQDEARVALVGRGFMVGNVVTVATPGVAPGTIVSPVGANIAAAGAAIDLVVAGTGPQTKLVFSVVGTKTIKVARHGVVAARISVSKPASVAATLVNSAGTKLHTWRFSVRAGVSIVKLRLPASAAKAGRYRLVWVATTATGEKDTHTLVVQVVGRAKSSPKGAAKHVDVVVAGADTLGPGLSISLEGSHVRVLTAESEDPTFALTGAQQYNVRVVVVDVDRFALSLVHDLRVVFPNVEVVALTGESDKLAKSVAAGATVALPRTTPPDQLARVVRRLSTP